MSTSADCLGFHSYEPAHVYHKAWALSGAGRMGIRVLGTLEFVARSRECVKLIVDKTPVTGYVQPGVLLGLRWPGPGATSTVSCPGCLSCARGRAQCSYTAVVRTPFHVQFDEAAHETHDHQPGTRELLAPCHHTADSSTKLLVGFLHQCIEKSSTSANAIAPMY